MRLFKKGMGIMLAASMLASLCACGNSSGSQTTESAVQKESTESADGDVSSEQVTLDLFINHTWWALCRAGAVLFRNILPARQMSI